MGTVYLFSLLLGAGFILVSLLMGDAEADVDFDIDTDLDLDADVNADTSWGRLFSMRSLVYFAFGFGLGGYLTTRAGLSPEASLTTAVPTGLLLSLTVTALFSYLKRTEMVSIEGDGTMIGRNGTVLVPPAGESPGRIRMQVDGRSESLLAYLADPEQPQPEPGTEVLVVDVRDGRLLISDV